jgi:predicted MPP superfamily phosphohydrolase
MKYVCIGDIHGRTVWKEIINSNPNSIFIFMGDYLDPYSEDITDLDAIENFKEIIEFKINNPGTILLIGNHDAQYLFYPKFQVNSAFSVEYRNIICTLFKENKNLFQFAFQINDYLFTHAGISKAWLKYHRNTFDQFGLNPDYSNIADVINNIAISKKLTEVFDNISYLRRGSSLYGSIIWADSRELIDNYIIGLKQIVGHTKFRDFFKTGDFDSFVIFIDVLTEQTKALIIEI